MKLRTWQMECLKQAILHFSAGNTHFTCLATPGAGKSILAAHVAKELLTKNTVNYILCLAPSLNIKAGLISTFEDVLKQPFDGLFGTVGQVLTYQSFQSISNQHLSRLSKKRLLIIVDEIHHCGGQSSEISTAWAQPLLTLVAETKQCLTLSLSGTPWRTDNMPVSTLMYENNAPSINYVYGLQKAISDNVCREPTIILVDNENWEVRKNNEGSRSHSSIQDLLKKEKLSYQTILENKSFLKYVLTLAITELQRYRYKCLDAAGLIVASSIEHAQFIAELLTVLTGKTPTLVTSIDKDSQEKIQRFKAANTSWLVSVGMVSEGTDIPRLQVCCHLTRIVTELHFRQVLGRIQRLRPCDKDKTATLIAPAQASITAFAEGLCEEVPSIEVDFKNSYEPCETKILNTSSYTLEEPTTYEVFLTQEQNPLSENTINNSTLDTISTTHLFAIGKFKKELLKYN